MVAGTISSAINALKENLRPGDELRLIADEAIYGDQDIEFEGVNIACVAPKIKNVKENGPLCIKTDGKLLPQNSNAKKASNGMNGTASDKAGKPGADGMNGSCGNPGGHILVVAKNLSHNEFVFSANGSRGDDGQDGGDGGDGWTPLACGRDGEAKKFIGQGLGYDVVMISYGTRGENGGPGGDAGHGGAPGKSGVSGKIQLIDLDNEINCQTRQERIEDGRAGMPGIPGKGGGNTRHGLDYGTYVEHKGWTKMLTHYYLGSDISSLISGELRHPNIPPPGYGSCYVLPGKGFPSQIKGPSHPDFTNRGVQNSGKHSRVLVNFSIAKENRAIDIRSCLTSAWQLCQEPAQHWNITSHSKFLSAFAQRIGETHNNNIIQSLKTSADTKVNIDLYLEKIHSQFELISTEQKARRKHKTQVHVLKDFIEDDTPDSVGYIGYDNQLEPLALNTLPLRDLATLQKIELDGLTLQTLLLSNEHDEIIEKLDYRLKVFKKPFVAVSCHPRETNYHRSMHPFLIVRDRKNQYHYHHSNEHFTFDDEAIVSVLKCFVHSVKENEIVVIERNDTIYPPIIELVKQKLGSDMTVPFTSEQLHCVEQLRLILAIKKTYHAMAHQYNEIEKRKALHKVYSHYVDKVLASESKESLTSAEQDMLEANSLILPLNDSYFQ